MPSTSPGRSAATPLPADQHVLITRTFDAPRELVFEAWTDRERLERWFAPTGCAIHFARIDVREGGAFHSCIRTPSGDACWCLGVYREIVAPERLVFSMAVADEHGNRIDPKDAGMDSDWPRETLVTVTFEDLGGKTRLTLRQTVAESLARRTGAYPSWLDMLERLAAALSP